MILTHVRFKCEDYGRCTHELQVGAQRQKLNKCLKPKSVTYSSKVIATHKEKKPAPFMNIPFLGEPEYR